MVQAGKPSPLELHALSRPRPIVVGYLEGPAGTNALQAAAAEARLRGAPLSVVHKLVGTEAPEVFASAESAEEHRRTVMARVLAVAHDVAPDLEQVDARVTTAPIAEELIVASRTALLLVLGVTTNHATTAALLDTVPREVVRHAHCPVLLVPPTSPAQPPNRLVCGLDRSASSIDALHWAAKEADLRGITVLAVEVRPATRDGRTPDPEEVSLSNWVRMHLPSASTTVVCSSETGPAGRRLLEIATESNGMLVIGSHSPGRRLGRSVVRTVTSQSKVPVVVVPHAEPIRNREELPR